MSGGTIAAVLALLIFGAGVAACCYCCFCKPRPVNEYAQVDLEGDDDDDDGGGAGAGAGPGSRTAGGGIEMVGAEDDVFYYDDDDEDGDDAFDADEIEQLKYLEQYRKMLAEGTVSPEDAILSEKKERPPDLGSRDER